MTQSTMQTSFRAIGSTTAGWNADALAAMAVELEAAELDVPASINGRLIAWLQLRLSSSATDLRGLWAEFRAAEPDGAFDPLP